MILYISICQVIFAQPKNIPLYCAQLLEEKLEERLRQEEEAKREEENIRRLEETHKRQIDQVREEFRRKSRASQKTQRHCESQTGFTTDSGEL